MWRSGLFWKLLVLGLFLIIVSSVLTYQFVQEGFGLAASILIGFAVCLVVALGAAFSLRRSLLSTKDAMSALGQGDGTARVRDGRHDEIGDLGRVFNEAAKALENRFRTITNDRQKLSAILAGMVEGVVAVDTDERIIHINGVAAEILETSPNSSIGRPVWEVSRLPNIGETLSTVLSKAEPLTREERLVGTPRDRVIALYASPMLGANGQVDGAVVVLHDVSELRRLEKIRSDFVANVSHELKTPVTAILGLVETLLEDDTDADTRKRFLSRIKHQSERMGALATDLLSLSRLESESAPLAKDLLDWRTVVSESIQSIRPAAERRGIHLSWTPPSEEVTVAGDREALRQVIDNLVDNAVKHTPSQGQVTVAMARAMGEAQLTVADTGVGIAPVHQARIFERFYRVDTSRSRGMGGTGLGLAIVKHIVQAHSGRVTVDSTPGSGAKFKVSLPLHLVS